MKILLISFLLILITNSCSPSQKAMKREDCVGIDWQRLGETDGSKGLSLEMLDYHIKRCSPKIESAARSKYIHGHSQGVPLYCNYRTGFIKAEVGDPIPLLCESSHFQQFHKGYREGTKARSK